MHPCQSGQRCSCHSAGPSNRTTTLIIASLVTPILAAPAPSPVALPFLYPTLAFERRITDAGQAPDDPSEGFIPESIELSDLVREGLPYKFVYDPTATVDRDTVAGTEVGVRESSGAWVMADAWQLHGKKFGPLSARATAGITDDPLPTPTEPVATASATATTTTTPSLLAIESSLPTGWTNEAYRRSNMYAIPLVVSFSVVIALMIGSLIGALAFRRGRSRSRRRKKQLAGEDDSVVREKIVRKGLAARLGRVLKSKDTKQPPQPKPRPGPESEPEPAEDVEVGEHAAERQRDREERSDVEQRVKSWARRSASWRVQARVGMRRRIARGRKRAPAEDDPGGVEVINEDREGEERVEREEAAVAATVAEARTSRTTSRAGTPVLEERTRTETAEENSGTETAEETRLPTLAVPTYASPAVPTYSSSSSGAGPSTDTNDAHPDAAPSDEPAYDDFGAGAGLPPAYRRGESRAEVRRGKMPERLSVSSREDVPVVTRREERCGAEEGRRVWTALDAYAYQGGRADACAGEEQERVVTAHVATDDKQVLERLRSMTGAPEEPDRAGHAPEAPREDEVFGLGGSPVEDTPGGSASGMLPSPSAKAGAGPVARYGEADLSLPRYLDEAPEGLAGSSTPTVPCAPPLEHDAALAPSAPPLEEGEFEPSAPPCDDLALAPSVPSAPPFHDDIPTPSAPPADDNAHSDPPHAPRLYHVSSSAPLLSREDNL